MPPLMKFHIVSGPLKVVYVDPAYTLAIVYQCFRVNSDGTCQRVYVDLIGREPLLPATARTALMAHVHKTCADANDFSDLAQSSMTISLLDIYHLFSSYFFCTLNKHFIVNRFTCIFLYTDSSDINLGYV